MITLSTTRVFKNYHFEVSHNLSKNDRCFLRKKLNPSKLKPKLKDPSLFTTQIFQNKTFNDLIAYCYCLEYSGT